jgi:hypothetical protein
MLARIFSILIMTLAATVTLEAQGMDRITGALGFEFITSKANVERMAKEKGYKLLSDAQPDVKLYEGNGRRIGTFAIQMLAFRFNNDKLAQIGILVDPSHPNKIIEDYLELQGILTKKYGIPTSDVKKFTYPYKWGDGDELTAISIKKADIWSEWRTVDIIKDNSLQLVLLDKETIRLVYKHGELAESIDQEIETRTLKDF